MKINEEALIMACNTSRSMSEARAKFGKIHPNTFKKYALLLGVYKPNRGAKGWKKVHETNTIPLHEILEGKHKQYQTFKLKNRLIKEGIKKNICEICGTFEWCGKQLMCELDHVNGDSSDHRLNNLRILCPNCHSQTNTFRSKNIK